MGMAGRLDGLAESLQYERLASTYRGKKQNRDGTNNESFQYKALVTETESAMA